ncbi:MAG: glutathione S-transferase [Halioglobus sp.]|nr:glutathione S-transferase [Halioglobus sp.]
MLELYTHPMSPCAQKVRIVLAEKALQWTPHHVSLQDKENLEPWYLQLNPLGVVPTLVHEGRAVIESSIICEYLEDAFPGQSLRPADPWKRSRMRFWMKHVDVKLHPACGTIQWPMVMRPALMAKPEEERSAILERIPEKPRRERQKRLVAHGLDAPDVADAVHTYRKTILEMEEVLGRHPWMVGDEFSLADACLAPYFQTLHQFDWTELFERDCPRVSDWFARCQGRASYQQAVAGDFPEETLADLRARGATAWDKISAHLDAA